MIDSTINIAICIIIIIIINIIIQQCDLPAMATQVWESIYNGRRTHEKIQTSASARRISTNAGVQLELCATPCPLFKATHLRRWLYASI